MKDAREVIAVSVFDLLTIERGEWPSQRADAIIAALSAAGLVIVPKEPTHAMVRASTCMAPTWDDDVSRAKWRAMVEAARDE
jgi:hypothetical protein